jgi:hypothetical protein
VPLEHGFAHLKNWGRGRPLVPVILLPTLSNARQAFSVLRVKAAAIAFSPGRSRKRYSCVTPSRLAIASVEMPSEPLSANSAIAARE